MHKRRWEKILKNQTVIYIQKGLHKLIPKATKNSFQANTQKRMFWGVWQYCG